VTNIFIGNLDITVTEQQLRDIFAAYGAVASIAMLENTDTGEPRGIAFVEMKLASEAKAAVAALHGTMLNGRAMRVNEARAKLDREPAGDSGMRNHRRHHN
jgi:RNA recognition motif-containing protein